MQQQVLPSPRITSVSWGRMQIEDIGTGKDFKLWPGGGRAWDWNETGTHHVPGILVADVNELLEHGARHIILSRGMLLALQTCRQTCEFLQSQQIPYDLAETRQAVKIYNQLASDNIAVGGLFHSTC